MCVFILEDEVFVVECLQLMLEKLWLDIEILVILDIVEDVVSYFSIGVWLDLVFFDIQLVDGVSFQVFELVKVFCLVIFMMVYDQYMLKVFKVNSIDYLFKFIGNVDLEQVLVQYEDLKEKFGQFMVQLQQVEQLL